MFYEQNARSLGVRGLGMFPAIAQEALPNHIEPFTTQDGVLTLRYQGVWLHHPEQALLEADAAVKALCTPGGDRVHVLVGLGLGYVLQSLFEASDGVIVVYEPYVDLLRFVLEHVNLSQWLSHPRVYLVTDLPTMATHIRQLFQADAIQHVDVVMLPSYGKLLGEPIYNQLARYLYELEGEYILAQRSRQQFGDRWLTHTLENTPAGAFPVEGLKGQYSHLPALVCDAGPSLDMASLKAFQPKAIVLATVAAACQMLPHQVWPDFVLVWDTEPVPPGWLAQTTSPTPLQLVLPIWAHPSWFQLPDTGRWIVSNKAEPELHHWLENLYGEALDGFPACRSVLTLGCRVAMLMGCQSINLVGTQWETPSDTTKTLVPVENHRYAVTAEVYYTLRELADLAQQMPVSLERLSISQPCPVAVPGFVPTQLMDDRDWEATPPIYKALYPLRSAFKGERRETALETLRDAVLRVIALCEQLPHTTEPDTATKQRCEMESLLAQHPLIRFVSGTPLRQWLLQPDQAEWLTHGSGQLQHALLPPLASQLPAAAPATLPKTEPVNELYPPRWMGHAVSGNAETHWVLQAYIKQLRPDWVVLVNAEPGTALFVDWVLDYMSFGRFMVICDELPTGLPAFKRGQFKPRGVAATQKHMTIAQREGTVLWCQPANSPVQLESPHRQCLARDEAVSFWLSQPSLLVTTS